MKTKNIVIGEEIQAKRSLSCEHGWWNINEGDCLKVTGIDVFGGVSGVKVKVGDKQVWLSPNDFRKPRLKQLDQSVFDGEDERWKFAVVNKDGSVTLFSSNEIIQHKGSHYVDIFCGQAKLLKVFADASNWKNSLIEREEVELIGSGLCKEMLVRGDKFVMCSVSDDSDCDALNDLLVVVIEKWEDGWFVDIDEQVWRFAVPLNNQGEPLSFEDVGYEDLYE